MTQEAGVDSAGIGENEAHSLSLRSSSHLDSLSGFLIGCYMNYEVQGPGLITDNWECRRQRTASYLSDFNCEPD